MRVIISYQISPDFLSFCYSFCGCVLSVHLLLSIIPFCNSGFPRKICMSDPLLSRFILMRKCLCQPSCWIFQFVFPFQKAQRPDRRAWNHTPQQLAHMISFLLKSPFADHTLCSYTGIRTVSDPDYHALTLLH